METTQPGRWRIELFGGLKVSNGEQEAAPIKLKKAAELLAYLALDTKRTHTREALMTLLWPDMDTEAGRNNLRQALTTLRRALEPEDVPDGSVLLADRNTVRLNQEAVRVDVTEFEMALQKVAHASTADMATEALEQACMLYRNGLLSGFYQDWVVEAQQEIEPRFCKALQRGVGLLEKAGEYERTLPFAKRALQIEPFEEEAHLTLMRLHAALGQSTAIHRQFQELERVLQAEIGVQPSAATRATVEVLLVQAEHVAAQAAPPSSLSVAAGRAVQPPTDSFVSEPAFPSPKANVSATPPLVVSPQPTTNGHAVVSTALVANSATEAPHANTSPSNAHSQNPQAFIKRRGFALASLALLMILPLLFVIPRFRHPETPKTAVPTPSPSHPSLRQLMAEKFANYRSIVLYTKVTQGDSKPPSLWATSPDGKVSMRIAEEGSTPRLSPNGRMMAFLKDKHLTLLDMESGETHILTTGDCEDYCPWWDHDSSRIFFISRQPTTDGVFVIDPDGSHLSAVKLFNNDDANFSLSVSPDGKYIAYARDGKIGCYQVFLMTVDGKNDHYLINCATSGPVWSRDGQQIACYAWPKGKEEGYYIMNQDGSDLQPLYTVRSANRICSGDILLPPNGEPLDNLIFPLVEGDRIYVYRKNRQETELHQIFLERGHYYSGLEWIPNPYLPSPSGKPYDVKLPF